MLTSSSFGNFIVVVLTSSFNQIRLLRLNAGPVTEINSNPLLCWWMQMQWHNKPVKGTIQSGLQRSISCLTLCICVSTPMTITCTAIDVMKYNIFTRSNSSCCFEADLEISSVTVHRHNGDSYFIPLWWNNNFCLWELLTSGRSFSQKHNHNIGNYE